MSNLSQIIRGIRRDAAALPTRQLRDQISGSLVPLEEAITRLDNTRPGAEMDYVIAVGDVMSEVLLIALYVRELTTRPVALMRENSLN
jgi:hypothetical protein